MKHYIIGYSKYPSRDEHSSSTFITFGKIEDYHSEQGFVRKGVVNVQNLFYSGSDEIKVFTECDFVFGCSKNGNAYIKEIKY